MKDFRSEYKNGADRYQISKDTLLNTKRKMYEIQKKKKTIIIQRKHLKRLLPVACMFLLCMSITVFAYEKYYVKYKTTNVNAGNSHEYIQDKATDFNASVGKTEDKKANIIATLQDIKSDSRSMYLIVRLNTEDGSPLNINDEDHITILERQGFKLAYFTVGSKRVDFTSVLRVDDGRKESEALFEVSYQQQEGNVVNLADFENQEVTVTLKNYQYQMRVKQNIGFPYDNIEKMIQQEGVKMAEKEEFVRVGDFINYGDGSTRGTYSLNAGNKKIFFSNQFPDSYIDNMGIYKSGEMEKDCLYLSIVPGSEEEKDRLSQLALFDMKTGHIIGAQEPTINDGGHKKYRPDDGRIVLIYDFLDGNTKILDRCILVAKKSDEKISSDNTWNFSFHLNGLSPEFVYEPEQVIKKEKVPVTIHSIKLTDSFFSLSATASQGFDMKYNGRIYLLLKDGSKVDVGPKIEGAFNSNDGDLNLSGYFSQLVDAGQVIGLEIWGNQVILTPSDENNF